MFTILFYFILMFTILKEYFIEFVTILFVLCFDFFFFGGVTWHMGS